MSERLLVRESAGDSHTSLVLLLAGLAYILKEEEASFECPGSENR